MVLHLTDVVESSSNIRSNRPLVAHSSVVSSVARVNSGLPNPTTSSTADNSSFPQLCGSSAVDSFQLVAWKVSSKDSELEKCQAELQY